jgi:hypothetical protein
MDLRGGIDEVKPVTSNPWGPPAQINPMPAMAAFEAEHNRQMAAARGT